MLDTIRIGSLSAVRTAADAFSFSRRSRLPVRPAAEGHAPHRTLASERPRMGRGADRHGDNASKSYCAAKIGAALHLPYS